MRLSPDDLATITAALADEGHPPLARGAGDQLVAICARDVAARDHSIIAGCPVVALDVLTDGDDPDLCAATWADVLGVDARDLYCEPVTE